MGTRRYPDEPVCCNNDVNRRVSGVRNDKSGRIRRESMYHNNCPLNISRSFASIIKKKKRKKTTTTTRLTGSPFVSRHPRRMGFFLISIRRDSSVKMLLRDRFIALAFKF